MLGSLSPYSAQDPSSWDGAAHTQAEPSHLSPPAMYTPGPHLPGNSKSSQTGSEGGLPHLESIYDFTFRTHMFSNV